MAINEILKANALANVAGNAGALQDSGYVTMNTLRQVLFELLGASQSGFPLPAGFLGGSFPGGESLTGTVMLARTVDAAALNSGAGATVNLKSFVVPAGVLGLGTNAAPGVRGLWFYTSGQCPNTGNVKSLTVAFGGSAAQTLFTVTTTIAAKWSAFGTVLTRTVASGANSTVVLNGYGTSSTAAGASPISGGANLAVTTLDLSTALTLQFACTQTSAADVIQDSLIVGYIP